MNLLRTFILACITFLSFTGCTTYYGVANYSTESSFIPKPSYRDSVIKNSYIGGNFYNTLGPGAYQQKENTTFGTLNYYFSKTRHDISIATGGFLYGGNYNAVTTNDVPGGDKYFLGGGMMVSWNYNIPFEHFDWRIFGTRYTILYEGGVYSNFRKKVIENSHIDGLGIPEYDDLNPKNISVNGSFSTELIYKHEKFDLGSWFSVGSGSQILTYGYGTYVSMDRLVSFLEINSSFYGNKCLGVGILYMIE